MLDNAGYMRPDIVGMWHRRRGAGPPYIEDAYTRI